MNVYTAEGTQSFFVSSGSYTVNSDSTVSIIAEEACRLADLDKDAATKALATAQVNNFKLKTDANPFPRVLQTLAMPKLKSKSTSSLLLLPLFKFPNEILFIKSLWFHLRYNS